MPKPKRKPRRDEILAAARYVLERDGLEALTVAHVAAEVPISEASVFYHFETKEQLLVEVALQYATDEFSRWREVARDARSGVDAICEVFRERARHYDRNPAALEIVNFWALANIDDDDREEQVALVNAIYDVFEQRLRDDLRRGKIARVRNLRRRIATLWVLSEGLTLTQFRLARGHLTIKNPLDVLIEEVVQIVRSSFA